MDYNLNSGRDMYQDTREGQGHGQSNGGGGGGGGSGEYDFDSGVGGAGLESLMEQREWEKDDYSVTAPASGGYQPMETAGFLLNNKNNFPGNPSFLPNSANVGSATNMLDMDESPQFTIDLELFFDPMAVDVDVADEFVATAPVQAPPQSSAFTFSSQTINPQVQYSNNLNPHNYQGQSLETQHNAEHTSISGINPSSSFHELSPLTTVNSHTPSVSSLHSTQPSFFSAQQYLTRNSIDQGPPSLYHRASLDLYTKSRVSIDSQHSINSSINNNNNSNNKNNRVRSNSGAAPGRYTLFTNSISNYIPFMNNQRTVSGSPSFSGPPSPSSHSPPFNNSVGHGSNNGMEQYTVPVMGGGSQQATPSRHLIRSIFKNKENGRGFVDLENAPQKDGYESYINQEDQGGPNMMMDGVNMSMTPISVGGNQDGTTTLDNTEFYGEGFLNEDLMMGTTVKDELEDVSATKKPKKSKRRLFTRFKSNPIEDANNTNNNNSNASTNNSNSNNTFNANMNSGGIPNITETELEQLDGIEEHSSISIPSSSAASHAALALDQTSLNTSHNQTTNNTSMNEPDYAALFEKVGKRKNIVKPSSYISKNKPRFKEQQTEAGIETTSNPNSYVDEDIKEEEEPLSLSSASRLLGNKLLTRKKDNLPLETSDSNSMGAISATSSNVQSLNIDKNGQTEGVEVDLESLDLPANTQVFPTSVVNLKSKIRGRKENKAADMLDLSKIFLCTHCTRRFKRQEHLKRHFRSLHTFDKPYDCHICHKKFSRSDNLNQHLKIHKLEEEELARREGLGGDGTEQFSIKEEDEEEL